MKNWIYTEMLFCDEENAAGICEYEEMLSLIKEFIESAEDAVECKRTMEWNTKDGVCFKFAEAIIRYAKSAYDNIILGHFSAAFMLYYTGWLKYIALSIWMIFSRNLLR